MEASTLWWITAGVAVAAELASGTFYLLMVALGLIGGALAAHLGASPTTQLLAAAVVGGGAVATWYRLRPAAATAPSVAANPDVNIDIGERLYVAQWNPDRTARVPYRGAQWSVRFEGHQLPPPGHYIIRAVSGNELLLGFEPE